MIPFLRDAFVTTLSMYCMSSSMSCLWVCAQLAKTLTSCDILLGLVAAATHDLDHPGVNQPFLIKTDHYLAALYKVRAP